MPVSGIGPSRGRLSAKTFFVAPDENEVIDVDVAEGQRIDAPLAFPKRALAETIVGRIDAVHGEMDFDSGVTYRVCLEEHDALSVVANRSNRVEFGRGRDHPRDRDAVEPSLALALAKSLRRFAGRYANLEKVFPNLVRLVVGLALLKRWVLSVHRPSRTGHEPRSW